jgi:hypothetical protein
VRPPASVKVLMIVIAMTTLRAASLKVLKANTCFPPVKDRSQFAFEAWDF